MTDYLSLRHDNLLIQVKGRFIAGYAIYRSGLGMIDEVVIENTGAGNSKPIRLKAVLDGYGDGSSLNIPVLEAGARVRLPVMLPAVNEDKLKKQAETAKAFLKLQIHDVAESIKIREIPVLGLWDWPYEPELRNLTASYVLPDNPVIESVIHSAERVLNGSCRYRSFYEIASADDDNAEKSVMRIIYDFLKNERQIKYEPPVLRNIPGMKLNYQTVRSPERIFIKGREGRGTCLDLSLMFAGCIENLGLCPLIFLTGDSKAVVKHSFVGCWKGRIPGGRPVIDDRGYLIKMINSEKLFITECTGFASGVGQGRSEVSFDEAAAAASKQMERAGYVCAVDISASRPPLGSYLPVAYRLAPDVSGVFDEAGRISIRLGNGIIETAYLIYGLMTVMGEVTTNLFEMAGLDPNKKLTELENELKRRSGVSGVTDMDDSRSAEPVPTGSFDLCRNLAERYALIDGVSTIRELDLWRSLADMRRNGSSSSLNSIAGTIELDRIVQYLGKLFPVHQRVAFSFIQPE